MERVIVSKSMMMRKAMSAAVIKLFIGFGGGSWFCSKFYVFGAFSGGKSRIY
jgi:hypothetical protein